MGEHRLTRELQSGAPSLEITQILRIGTKAFGRMAAIRRGTIMRKLTLTALVLCAGLSAQAKDKPAYEKGTLVQMESASCGYSEKDGKTLTGEILGTDGQHKKTQEVLCQEYVLQSERITYRIRPKDD